MTSSRASAIIEPLLTRGPYRYGFADLRGLLTGEYAAYSWGIAILRRLDDRIIDAVVEGPTPAYLEHYRAVNDELTAVVTAIGTHLRAHGITACAVDPTFHDREADAECRRTLVTPLSHKMVATRAGLGWIGKTDLFVTDDWGPRLRLAAILLTEPLADAGTPVNESQCGSCRICVDACPGATATGEPWNISTHRDTFFNAFKCRDTCRRLARERLNEDISLCGICVARCPRGHAAAGQQDASAP